MSCPVAIHRLRGVDDQVHEDLLDLGRVHEDLGQVFAEVINDPDVVEQGLIIHQGDTFLQDPVHVGQAFVRFALPGEIQQAANDVAAAIGLLDDLLEGLPRAVSSGRPFQEQMRIGDDALEGIVDLVGHARRQLADVGEPLRLHDPPGGELAQFFVPLLQRRGHEVERVRQLPQFVVGANLDFGVQVAVGHLLRG